MIPVLIGVLTAVAIVSLARPTRFDQNRSFSIPPRLSSLRHTTFSLP